MSYGQGAVHECIYIHTNIYKNMYICIFIRVCVCVCVYVRVYRADMYVYMVIP